MKTHKSTISQINHAVRFDRGRLGLVVGGGKGIRKTEWGLRGSAERVTCLHEHVRQDMTGTCFHARARERGNERRTRDAF